ncbi:MAG: class C beta-lactamase-related serine hydrolase [Candidatus Dadabacteria bacterium]|nr:MAG: class C beta-lactamase-related serine hydrolase [Candidatus Dadabacteria bacterium]
MESICPMTRRFIMRRRFFVESRFCGLNVSVLVLLAGLMSACSSTAVGIDDAGLEPDWRISSAKKHGFDEATLDQARAYAFQDELHTQGVVIVHKGEIITEWYAPEIDADSWATSWSVAKSFASTLIGIAIDEGRIASVDVTLATWYPQWATDDRGKITLRQVLTMTTGLKWVETSDPFVEEEPNLVQLVADGDELGYVLNSPLETTPGTRFYYSSGNSLLFSGILDAVLDEDVQDFARTRLFEPLGFSKWAWWQDGAGHTLTYCCIDTTARDFARFGQMALQHGVWGGKQIVSTAWLTAATTPSEVQPSYGFQWWLNQPGGEIDYPELPRDMFSARGLDGQYIYVLPSQQLVVVRVGEYKKPEGEEVAPNGIISAGLVPGGLGGTGTTPPEESWNDASFLKPILDAMGE